MKTINLVAAFGITALTALSPLSNLPSAFAHDKEAHSKPETSSAKATEMTDGEVRKIDLDNKKITLKHGDIKSLDMPGMTMVFQIKDPAMLEKLKAGDKVKFSADKLNGAFVVTDIQLAK